MLYSMEGMVMEQTGKARALSRRVVAFFLALVLGFSGFNATAIADRAYAAGSNAGHYIFLMNSYSLMPLIGEVVDSVSGNDVERIYISPKGVDDSTLSFTSSNPAVATVDQNGFITAVGNGLALIEISSTSGLKSTKVIRVCDLSHGGVPESGDAVEQVIANTNVVRLTEAEQYVALSEIVLPTTAKDKDVTWKSSNESVATPIWGRYAKAVAPGEAIFTGTTSNGKSCRVRVIVDFNATQFVDVKSISLSSGSLGFTALNQSRSLTATVLPVNATNKAVTWTSSNTSVATVSNGVVKSVGNGSATITARAANGKTATCSVVVDTSVSTTGVSLSATAFSLTSKSATKQLTATVSPANATNKSVTWSSSNGNVATVTQSGLVRAVGNGTATITARAANGLTATAKVTVSIPVAATSVRINQGSFTLSKKSSYKNLTATVSPSNATNKSVTWSTSNQGVAKVSSTGKVTPVKNGTAYITAKTSNGKTAKVKVTVKIVYPSSVKITTKAFTLTKKGATKAVKATVSPSSATDKTVTWSSSNSKVATVSSTGKVTAVKNGTATIKAKTANGKISTVKVTVKIPVAVTSVRINQSAFTLTRKGATKQLSATVSPSSATNKKVTWSSSNNRVAAVSSTGKVTAVGNGTATITAKSSNGKTAKLTMKVSIPKASATVSNGNNAAKAREIFNAYNQFRAGKHLPQVAWDNECANMAVESAKGNADGGAGFNGKKLVHKLGIPASKQGSYSDILQFATWGMSGSEAVQRWSQSSGHRKMMQCVSAKKAGVAAYKRGNGWYYVIVYNFTGSNQSGN